VKEYGLIVIKGLNLEGEDMVKLGEQFGDEIVTLPNDLAFNN
jgi:hypothetical protein